MAQLRQDYQKFVARQTEIIVIGPEDRDSFAYHWHTLQLPFIGLPDPDHIAADLYGQQVKLLKLGRMPALVVIDKAGRIRYSHYGASMQDIPANGKILTMLDELNQETIFEPDFNLA